RSRRRHADLMAGERLPGPRGHLAPGNTCQHPAGTVEIVREHGARGSRIPALRCANPRVPELPVVEVVRPRPLHETHEAVAALDRGLVALPAERQDGGFGGNRWRSGTTGER